MFELACLALSLWKIQSLGKTRWFSMTDGGEEKKIRVGIVVPPIFSCPPQGYGGEIMCWDLAEALGRLGVEVHLFAVGGSEVPTGGFLHYVPHCTLDVFWAYEQAPIKFYESMVKEDDIIFHDWTHTHIIHDYLFWNGKGNVISTPWGAFIQRPYYRSHLVTWSKFQRELAIQQGFPTSTRWVHGGTNTEMFSPDPDKSFEKDGYFLFCARMHPDKRPDLFLQLAKEFPNEEFVLSGSFGKTATPDHAYYGKFYMETAKKLSNVKVVPDPTKQQQIELLRHAKALVHPSVTECFGLAIVEALSCGTPVIVSREGAFPEIVVEGKTGWLCENFGEYVNAVRNVDVLNPLIARNDAVKRFNRLRVAEDYLELYKKLLDGETW